MPIRILPYHIRSETLIGAEPLPTPSKRYFTDAARASALAARLAKRNEPDTFGVPELFIVKAGTRTFTWELRRFGGLVLQRGADSFTSVGQARADGGRALAILCAMPDMPTFKRQDR